MEKFRSIRVSGEIVGALILDRKVGLDDFFTLDDVCAWMTICVSIELFPDWQTLS